jgi:gliding motility-associated-like protein
MLKTYTRPLLSLIFLLGTAIQTKAQISVNDHATATDMVQALVGAGITFSNPQLNCHDSARGTYTVVTSNLGIGDGVLLTSGKAKTTGSTAGANGDQNLWFAATSNNTPGDNELETISGVTTFDACILEFDFVPDGDSLLFDYVFGSEEYDGFSCTGFNDVFAFFLSGPGITGSPNIALVPGTNIPVSINSTTNPTITQPSSLALCQAMGPGSPFAQYYNDNTNGQSVTYYGMTTVLTARAAVIPCTTYHIKLAIADGSDPTLDSGVFLAGNSFRSTNIKMKFESSLSGAGLTFGYLVEGCTDGTINVERSTAFNIPQTVKLSYGGTAIKGVDYVTPPDSVIIPASGTLATITITPIQDYTKEGFEKVVINILNACTGDIVDSLVIDVFDNLPSLILSDDSLLCAKEPFRLQVSGDSIFNWFWRSTPDSKIDEPSGQFTYGYPDTTTTYYISAEYKGCYTDTQSVVANVQPTPIPQIMNDTALCLRQPLKIEVGIGPDHFTDYTYVWFPGTNLDDPFAREPNFWIDGAGTFTYVLAAQTPLGCTGLDTFTIVTRPAVELTDVTENFTAKYGQVVQLNADATNVEYWAWTPDRLLDYPNIKDPKATATDPTTFMVIGMNFWGCKDTAYVKMDIDYSMLETIPSAFSPNGDGRNDVFRIGQMKYQRLLEFRIFSRWGHEVYSSTDLNKGWDGTYKGEPQEVGVYHYIIRVATPDGKMRTFKGDVTLVR